ncbi:MAG: enoyl-CoA hydratase family protein [Candidatus Microthrix sp.]|uniref:Enoyl-CoA hydratase family protein n=1 Tax=Candidatus Neomicrothrix subdominans TaxID=2954438 RepID=A0A936NA10_9ACTN|nr:enoyl-CoA hydratase family protein [Candidatus Microthrix subdominans]
MTTASPTTPPTADSPVVLRSDNDRIATLTLDSPENRNALSSRLVGELAAHLRDVEADDAVRAVVLTHTGNTFCAGADLAEGAREGGPAKGVARLVALLRQIIELDKPVVAKVDGNVRAGGLGLFAACDLTVAGLTSSFALTEARLGLSPAVISLTVLPRLTDRAASRYYLTGDRFDAAEAERIGLVTITAEDPDAAVAELAASFRRCSAQGLAASKQLTTHAMLTTFDSDAERLIEMSATLFSSEDAQEGIASFMERRPPRWAE